MRPAKINRDMILSAAVKLIDEQGLEALTMRKLGRELGVEAMSLYRHVTNKQDLLDGIHGHIVKEMVFPTLRGTWVDQLRDIAHAFRAVLIKHPRALPIFAGRRAVTPTALQHLDTVVGILETVGFSELGRLSTIHAMVSLIVGSAFQQFGAEDISRPDYETLAETYPHFGSLANEIMALTNEEEFDASLNLLLEGLKVSLAKSRANPVV